MNKKRFAFQFIIIYLCVLLPTILTAILITGQVTKGVQSEITSNLENNIHKAELELDSNFRAFHDKAILLFSNRELQNNLINLEPVEARDAIRILNNIQSFSEAGSTLLVYYGEDSFFYRAGMEGTRVFWNHHLGFTKESIQRAETVIRKEETRACVLWSTTDIPYVLYHIPAGFDKHGYPRSLEMVSRLNDLAVSVTKHLPEGESLLRVEIDGDPAWFTRNGQQLLACDQSAAEMLIDSGTLTLAEGTGSGNFQISIWYDVNTQLAGYNLLRTICILLLTCGFALSLGLSLLFALRRVREIESLSRKLTSKSVADSKKYRFRDYEYLQSLINVPMAELSAMQTNKRMYRKQLAKQAARLLFHGGSNNDEEVSSMLRLSGIELFEEYFFLSGLELDSKETCEKIESLMFEDLYYICQEDNSFFAVFLHELPCLDFDKKLRTEYTRKLRNYFKSSGIPTTSVVVSQVYDRITKAGFAYYEVICMLEDDKRAPGILCWEAWARDHIDVASFAGNTLVDEFRNALIQRNVDLAMEVIRSIGNTVQERNTREYIRYLFVQTVLMHANQEGITQKVQNKLQSINLRMDKSFEKTIGEILTEIYQLPEKNFDQILEYVHENYCSADLSLEAVAGYGGVSKSKLSRIFVAKTGQHYLKYVTMLRMQRVSELLQETDTSVRDVFIEVGYNDTVNASRKFKKQFGLTPSEYRASCRKGAGNE